jgi:hypothetical protein
MTVPTYTPATYTVPESKVWRSPDGSKNYYWYAGDIISMALAIEMGMPDAGYGTASPFTTTEEERIVNLLAEQGGGAVPMQTHTDWDRFYDNRTAGAGVEANYTIFPNTLVGGLIRVEETGKQLVTVGFRVITGAADATARVSVYGNNPGNVSARGMAGSLLHDAGTVSAATAGFKSINIFAAGLAVDPDLYWILIEPSAELTIAGFQSHAGHLGQNTATGAVYSGMTHNRGVSMDPHPASISTAARAALAPLVIFALDVA